MIEALLAEDDVGEARPFSPGVAPAATDGLGQRARQSRKLVNCSGRS